MTIGASLGIYASTPSAATEPITGYDAWWDASRSNAVAIDGSNGVDQLNDLSGNSKHLTLTSTTKPTYLIGASGINGLNCLDFTDTTLRHLTTGFFAANYSGTVLTSYAVGSIAQVGSNFRRMLTAANGTGSDSTPTTACMLHCSINTTGSPIGSFRGNVTRSNLAQSTGTVYVHACVYDGTNNTYYLNSVAGTPVAVTGAFGFNRYRLGNNNAGPSTNNQLVGRFGEAIVYFAAHTPAQISQNIAYLSQKWKTPG